MSLKNLQSNNSNEAFPALEILACNIVLLLLANCTFDRGNDKWLSFAQSLDGHTAQKPCKDRSLFGWRRKRRNGGSEIFPGSPKGRQEAFSRQKGEEGKIFPKSLLASLSLSLSPFQPRGINNEVGLEARWRNKRGDYFKDLW